MSERRIVAEPTSAKAGFAVFKDDRVQPHETKYRVEQVWSNGDVEPVYIGDERDVEQLIAELERLTE